MACHPHPNHPRTHPPNPHCPPTTRLHCSVPTVTDAQVLGNMDFRMTVTPNITSPYTAYPPGGWTHYIVSCNFNAAISYGYCP